LIASKRDSAERVIESGDDWITEMSDLEVRRLLSLRPSAMET
jgi:hypothetical protein